MSGAVIIQPHRNVIDAHEVENGGVEVVAVSRALEGLVAPFVALTITRSMVEELVCARHLC